MKKKKNKYQKLLKKKMTTQISYKTFDDYLENPGDELLEKIINQTNAIKYEYDDSENFLSDFYISKIIYESNEWPSIYHLTMAKENKNMEEIKLNYLRNMDKEDFTNLHDLVCEDRFSCQLDIDNFLSSHGKEQKLENYCVVNIPLDEIIRKLPSTVDVEIFCTNLFDYDKDSEIIPQIVSIKEKKEMLKAKFDDEQMIRKLLNSVKGNDKLLPYFIENKKGNIYKNNINGTILTQVVFDILGFSDKNNDRKNKKIIGEGGTSKKKKTIEENVTMEFGEDVNRKRNLEKNILPQSNQGTNQAMSGELIRKYATYNQELERWKRSRMNDQNDFF